MYVMRMDPFTIGRILLPLLSAVIFAFAASMFKPPKPVLLRTLKFCWVIGFLNLVADVIGTRLSFWHYTVGHLLFGLPVDIYITVSLAYGGIFLFLYWWLRSYHPRWAMPFAIILPFYGLLRDYLGQHFTGDLFLVWDSPTWWIPDLLSWAIGMWLTLFLFDRLIRSSMYGRREAKNNGANVG